jgi:hypothetical protein
MIVNAYSILMLFMAGLGLVLAGMLVGASLKAAWRIRRSRGHPESSAAERSAHLAALVAAVCLAILVIGWPLLYAMLASFVPEVPGAMCIYGVTRVMPGTAALIQVARPAAIFVLGAWLLLEHVRRQSGALLRRSAGMLALAGSACLVACACGAELYYVLNMNSLNEVSCCSHCARRTSAKLEAAEHYLPWGLPGPQRRAVLNGFFVAGVPLLAVWLLAQSRRPALRRKGWALARGALLLVTAAGLGFAWLLEFSEVLAPLLMRLPFHHCLYCLLFNGKVPDSPLMVGNLALGVLFAGWAAILEVASSGASPGPAAPVLERRLCLLGATTLAAGLLMVGIHLIVNHG